MPKPGWSARATGVMFALGSLEHLVGFVLFLFQINMYANYPGARHAVFTVVDASIAYVAFRHPRLLVFALTAFLAEQIQHNGTRAWHRWQASGDIDWVTVVVHTLVLGATVAAFVNRRRLTRRSVRYTV